MEKAKKTITKNELICLDEVRNRLFTIKGEMVILDSDVAYLYGVETRRVNEAVRNNKNKFPSGYMYSLNKRELESLRSKISTANLSNKTRVLPKVFTEKGLYMLATILKSRQAVETTFAIIEAFAAVRELKRELISIHNEANAEIQQSKIQKFGDILSDVVMPDLQVSETESTIELDFIIGKIKHTVKRTKTKESK